LWKILKPLTAFIGEERWRVIPAGEDIEVAVHLGDGNVLVFWEGSKEAFGSLRVAEADLESCAERVK
jgi:hypothetical protein